MIKHSFVCDLNELFGRTVIEQFKLKEMIRVGKYNEKAFLHSAREVNKLITHFSNDFSKYRMGKITFRKTVKVGGINQE